MQMLTSWKPCSTCGCVSQHMESKHSANSLQNESQQHIAAALIVVTSSQPLQEYCTLLPYPVYILVSIWVIKYDFLHYLINPVTSTCTFSVFQSLHDLQHIWLLCCQWLEVSEVWDARKPVAEPDGWSGALREVVLRWEWRQRARSGTLQRDQLPTGCQTGHHHTRRSRSKIHDMTICCLNPELRVSDHCHLISFC